MKKLILVLSVIGVALAFGASSHGQGTIVFNNLDPDNGKVYFNAALLNQDLNFSLLVVDPIDPRRILYRSWLLSDGTAKGINVGPGLFADPSHSVIVLPGTAPGTVIRVYVDVWTGNFAHWENALQAGEAIGETTFVMGAGSVEAPPANLKMGNLDVGTIPEPRTIS